MQKYRTNKSVRFSPRYNYKPGLKDPDGQEIIYDRQANKYVGARRVMEQFKSRFGMRVASMQTDSPKGMHQFMRTGSGMVEVK